MIDRVVRIITVAIRYPTLVIARTYISLRPTYHPKLSPLRSWFNSDDGNLSIPSKHPGCGSLIMESSSAKRSASMSRNRPPSRPTTPLRPSSRTSLRESQGNSARGASSSFPLESWEPAFAELSDSMADLEANFMHLQLMHESLSRFNESFASFLYGLNMNAFCVDFPEVSGDWLQLCPTALIESIQAPLLQSFQRAAQNEETSGINSTLTDVRWKS